MAAYNDVPVVALSGVTKRFGGANAADDVSITFRGGEVHSVIGENGAGKSTLMNILGGVLSPDAGTILIDGEAVTLSNPRQAEAMGITKIPQELDLFDEMTVAENIFIGRRQPRTSLGLLDHQAIAAHTKELGDRLHVNFSPNTPVRLLRAAGRQLVAIARALAVDARVLILDEPTAALTEVEAEMLLGVVRKLADEGTAIIYISHRLDEIFSVSDTITVLRDGRVVGETAPSEVTESGLVSMMVGREASHLYTRTAHSPGKVVLEVDGLTRRGEYEGISLSIRAGEIVGLSGLIGAGRTEFAHSLFGLTKPDSGSYAVGGVPRKFKSPREAQEAGVGYVPEERRSQGLVLNFSLAENITYNMLGAFTRLGLVLPGREKPAVAEAIRGYGIRARSQETPVSMLSGGNQQKVVLAKTLLRKPQLIILDEPTRGVDVGAKAEIYRLIDELARNGAAVLLISSELAEVLSMSDRVVVMRLGQIAVTFGPGDATAQAVGAAQAGVGSMTAEDPIEK